MLCAGLVTWVCTRLRLHHDHSPDALANVCKTMNKEAAPGLDCWPAECLRFVNVPAATALLHIYRAIEVTGVWPRPWRLVRTHLVPKTESPVQDTSQCRPLSVMSIWYRLWGSYHLRLLPAETFARFADGLRGGIPQRGLSDMLAKPALRLEASLNGLTDEDGNAIEMHWANIDAAKCFDRLSMVRAAEAAADFGLPVRLVTTLVSYWTSVERYLSLASYIDVSPVLPRNGIPQGCAVSAVVCNCMIQQWHDCVMRTQCMPSAFIDDRYISAPDPQTLEEGWRASTMWEDRQGWKINVSKSAHIQHPCSHHVLARNDDVMPKPKHFVSLGVDLAMSPNVPLLRQRERCGKAVESARKIERLRLPTHTAQILLEIIVMPQAIHHLQIRPLSRRCEEQIRMATQRAAGLYRRAHCVPIVNALLRKPHRADPASYAMYVHLTTIAGALRVGGEAWRWWQHLRSQPLRAAPRGPRATMCVYMQRHNLVESPDGRTLYHPRAGECEWIRVQSTTLGHYLRVVLRDTLLLKAAAKRPELAGICDVDVPTTVGYYRKKDNLHRQELAAILCDGLWTMAKKKQAGLVGDATCRACGEGKESVAHVWWECRAWAHLRTVGAQTTQAWQQLPRYAWKCLLCPSGMPEALCAAWPAIQKQCSLIWRERNRVGLRQGWVLSEGMKRSVKRVDASTLNEAPPAETHDPRACALTVASEAVLQASYAYPFALTYALSSPKNPWIYSRSQWHRLTHFASRLHLPQKRDSHYVVRPSVLELYLAYLHANGRSPL